jgi:hypothetical protein
MVRRSSGALTCIIGLMTKQNRIAGTIACSGDVNLMMARRRQRPSTGNHVDMMLTELLQPLCPVLPPMACAWIM